MTVITQVWTVTGVRSETNLWAEDSPIDFITLIGDIYNFSLAGGPDQLPLTLRAGEHDEREGGDDGDQVPAGPRPPLPGPPPAGHAAPSPHQDRGEPTH